MKMRSQIILAQLPAAIIIFLVAISFIFTLTSIKNQSNEILVDNYKSIICMHNINNFLEEIDEINNQRDPKTTSKEKSLQSFIEQELLIQDKNIKDPNEKELTLQLHEKWRAYKKAIASPSQTSPPPQFQALYKEIKNLTSQIMILNQDELLRKKEKLSNFISSDLLFITFGAGLALLFGFTLSWIFTGFFLSPLNILADSLSQVGKEGKTTFMHIKGSEEVENLCHEYNLMLSRIGEYHQGSLGQVMTDYQTLKEALAAYPDPLIFLSPQLNIIFINEATRKLLSFSYDFSQPPALFHFETQLRDAFVKIATHVLQTKTDYIPEKAKENISLSKDNKKLLFSPWAYPIKKSMNAVSPGLGGVVIILQDLMRQTLPELSKTDLYETLVHEFRSPLTELKMAIHLCTEGAAGPLTEKQEEILFAARDKADFLEKVCQNILALSEGPQKSQEHPLEDVDLTGVVSKLITSLQLDATQKGILIHFEEPPFLSKIKAHHNEIKTVVINLLRNAIHYADSGTIVRIKISEDNDFIKLSVNNQGPSIPTEHRKSIFKKHFKVPGQSKERAGLGLYISKNIVSSLKGKMGFRSSEKQGTTFWVTFPVFHEVG